MISLICTNCQAELTMDDAFAGGVCRCQHCGTIQTVPKRAAADASRASAAKALYQRTAAGPQVPSSGLEGLSALGAGGSGSGLGSSGLESRHLATQTREPTAIEEIQTPVPQDRALPILPLAVVVVVMLVMGVAGGLFFWARGGSSPVASVFPTFAGVAINATSVIYILDNSHSTDTLFDPLKAACFRSLETLGSDRKFQVMLWDDGDKSLAYPPDQMRTATPLEIAACKRAFADSVAAGNRHLAPALKQALAQKPGAVIIATAKWELDRDDLAALAAAGDAGVHFYTFGVGTAPEQGALKLAATGTGGRYKHLSPDDLNHASD